MKHGGSVVDPDFSQGQSSERSRPSSEGYVAGESAFEFREYAGTDSSWTRCQSRIDRARDKADRGLKSRAVHT